MADKFSKEQIEEFRKSTELTDEELESVGGGYTAQEMEQSFLLAFENKCTVPGYNELVAKKFGLKF